MKVVPQGTGSRDDGGDGALRWFHTQLNIQADRSRV
jgi:hypothetical protein